LEPLIRLCRILIAISPGHSVSKQDQDGWLHARRVLHLRVARIEAARFLSNIRQDLRNLSGHEFPFKSRLASRIGRGHSA
jgi:hypothetical protein